MLELVCSTVAFDGATLTGKPGSLTHVLSLIGAPVCRFLVVFLAILTTFSYLARERQLTAFSEAIRAVRIRRLPAMLHFMAMAGFALAANDLYLSERPHAPTDVLTFALLAFAIIAGVAAGLAILPWILWKQVAGILGSLWAWSAGAAILIVATAGAVHNLWLPATNSTFQLVRFLLRPFVPLTVIDPAHLHLGTKRFTVIISPECSGLEGVSLVVFFGALWLILFRKESRFPQALLLLPLGAAVQFLLNGVRIAALLLIGNSGARQIAAGGFHSQAGWICFNAVSLGLCVAARRLPWFTKQLAPAAEIRYSESSWTSVYLLPFLAILGAGMLSHAMSGGFEWLYSLRVTAALAVFWYYRREYSQILRLPMGMPWVGFGAGVLVFALWIGFDRILGTGSPAEMPLALQHTSAIARNLWIVPRIVSAVAIVPAAEELAFRGFLMRRIRSRDFELAPAQSLYWPGLLVSSALFGMLHGARWPAGMIAGLIYGLTFLRKGCLGEAVVAHATTNALLAVSVLMFGAWQYW